MSYARFGATSDVYVYAHYAGFVECCGCKLSDEWAHHSAEAIVAHLKEHVAAGHSVPEYLLDVTLYPDDDFIAMCEVFLCRKQVGHEGAHTPVRDERDQAIRAKLTGSGGIS